MSSMAIFGILVFAILSFFISFLPGRMNDFDKGKIATCMTIIAWSSLIFRLYIGRTIQ